MAALVLIPSQMAGGQALEDWPRRPMPESPRQLETAVWREGLYFMRCAELEHRLGIPEGELEGLTLTLLPDSATGQLSLDGVEAPLYTRLGRDEIDRLVYEPADAYLTAHIGFIPEYGGYQAAVLRIEATEAPVLPPVIWGEAVFTLSGMPREGSIAAADQMGSFPRIALMSEPKKGVAVIVGDRYTYTPQPGARGRDSFVLVAVDSRGVYSEPYTVTVDIEQTPAPKPFWPTWLRLQQK